MFSIVGYLNEWCSSPLKRPDTKLWSTATFRPSLTLLDSSIRRCSGDLLILDVWSKFGLTSYLKRIWASCVRVTLVANRHSNFFNVIIYFWLRDTGRPPKINLVDCTSLIYAILFIRIYARIRNRNNTKTTKTYIKYV